MDSVRALPRAIGRTRYLVPLLVMAGLLPGCVSPPTAAELLATGFRTPEQTFETFQVAVRARENGLARRCFSSAFLAQNRLSGMTFGEFIDELEDEEPFLRKGLADAEIVGPVQYVGIRARLEAVSHGTRMQIEFVREGFGEVWSGDQRTVDENLDFDEHTGIQSGADGGRWFFGQLPLPAGAPSSALSELRIGTEWKIDALGLAEAPSKSPSNAPRE